MNAVEYFFHILPDLLDGTVITLQLTLIGLVMGLVLGLPTAVAKVYGGKFLKGLATAYIELFRGTPLLVQLFIIYYGLPDIGITFSRMNAAVLALGLNSGAYQAEYLRGAIQAIGSGQMRAARAIGMTRFQAIRFIILPQALRFVIPAWSNEPVSLLKVSAITFLIAVPDLMTEAKIAASQSFRTIETYIAAAILYLVIVLLLTLVLNYVEKKVRIPGFEMQAQRN